MDSTGDIIVSSDAVKTENDTSATGGPTINQDHLNLNTGHVKNVKLPAKNNSDNRLENEVYNLMCPWDYLVNFSNVSVTNQPSNSSTSNLQM